MKIRPAVEADLHEWARMRSQLWPEAAESHILELQAYFADRSTDIVLGVVLERDRETLAGFMELNIRNFAEGSRSPEVPYIEGWYVDPPFRGHGWGKKLIVFAEAWALEKGYRELASDTELVNEKSISLHKALGFEETYRIVCFLKRLPPNRCRC